MTQPMNQESPEPQQAWQEPSAEPWPMEHSQTWPARPQQFYKHTQSWSPLSDQ